MSLIATFFGLFLIPHHASAEDPTTLQPGPNLYVTDNAHILDQTTIDLIVKQNQKWQETNAKPEVAVVTINSVGDYGDVDNFSDALLRQSKWKIGNEKYDNGVMILFAKNNGKNNMRISTGYGAEGILPDVLTYHLMTENLSLIKSSKSADQNKAIANIFNDVTSYVNQIADDPNATSDEEGNDGGDVLIFIFIVIFIVIVINNQRNRGKGGGGGYTGISTSGIWVNNSSGGFDGGFSGGGSFGGGSFGGGGSSV